MKDLNEARIKLNDIDDKMKSLFIERMNIVKDIALYKKENIRCAQKISFDNFNLLNYI